MYHVKILLLVINICTEESMSLLLDGKVVSASIREKLKQSVAGCVEKFGRVPGIAVIIAGDDPASHVYVSSKEKAASDIGFYSIVDRVSDKITTEGLLELIDKYNNDERIDGILVQLPVPKGVDDKKILRAIDPSKDVDGFHPFNVGLLNIGEDTLISCTPAGIMEILKYYNIDTAGKDCVIIGRSNIVGKPMSAMMIKANATVTVCHSKTKDIEKKCSEADILVAAIGIPKFVKSSFIKKGAVVIDVGMNRDEYNKLCGDVDFENVNNIVSAITPVPGGVGPMTITMLMSNTLKSFMLRMDR